MIYLIIDFVILQLTINIDYFKNLKIFIISSFLINSFFQFLDHRIISITMKDFIVFLLLRLFFWLLLLLLLGCITDLLLGFPRAFFFSNKIFYFFIQVRSSSVHIILCLLRAFRFLLLLLLISVKRFNVIFQAILKL